MDPSRNSTVVRNHEPEPWPSTVVSFQLTESGWSFTGSNWALPNLGFVLVPILLVAIFVNSLLNSEATPEPRSLFQWALVGHALMLVLLFLVSVFCLGLFVSFGKMTVRFDGEKYTIFEGIGTLGVTRQIGKEEVRRVARVSMGKNKFGIYLFGLKKTLVGVYLNEQSQVFLAEVWQAMLDSPRGPRGLDSQM